MALKLRHLTYAMSSISLGLCASMAGAHEGHDTGLSFDDGLLHAATGYDHILIAAALGALTARLAPAPRFLICLAYGFGIFAGALEIEHAVPLVVPLVAGAALLVAAMNANALPNRPDWRWPAAAAILGFAFSFMHSIVAAAPPHSVLYLGGLSLASVALVGVWMSLAGAARHLFARFRPLVSGKSE